MVEPRPRLAARLARSPWPLAFLVGVSALVSAGWDLPSEPLFADESAYFSQSYFATTFAEGRFNDPVWLEYQGFDLPPFPKYLIGFALRAGGRRLPGPAEARAWYKDTETRFDPPGALTLARIPIVFAGALGCLAVYGIGVTAWGRCAGGLAAALVMANPLYRLHARRAMSDVPCEAFMLLGLFFGLRLWRRQLSGRSGASSGLLAVASGLCVGLSVLSKLSGLLGVMILSAWVTIALLSRGDRPGAGGFAAWTLLAFATSAVVFVSLNPFLTAHPRRTLPEPIAAVNRLSFRDRIALMFRLRFKVSADRQVMFPRDALHTPAERLAVSEVQGFGRFGPFGPSRSDSEIRFDPGQDRGAVIWLPWVLAGALWAAFRGRSQAGKGELPTAWAILAQFVVAFAVVTLYLPMAWDRYLLPIQAPAALLASGVAVAAFRQLAVFCTPRRAGAA